MYTTLLILVIGYCEYSCHIIVERYESCLVKLGQVSD